MQVGLEIAEGVKINIGETYENTIKALDDTEIEYDIPYNKTFGNKKQIIIYMRSEGIELNITDGIVSYIKASNAHRNTLFTLDQNLRGAKALKYIRKRLAEMFDTPESEIQVDEFNAVSYETALTLVNDKYYMRIRLHKNLKDQIYIQTIRILEEEIEE